jgi:hypothetical protein
LINKERIKREEVDVDSELREWARNDEVNTGPAVLGITSEF